MSTGSVFGAIFVIVFGLVFAGLGGYMWVQQGEEIKEHEPVEATVVSSEVVESDDEAGESDDTYHPEIVFRYTVGGENYTSSSFYPGPGQTYKSGGWAEKQVEKYPEGKEVTAYYDPQNPSDAFLVKKREQIWLAPLGFGGLFVLLGLYQLVSGVAGLAGKLLSLG